MFFLYVSDYYPADERLVAELVQNNDIVTETESDNGIIMYTAQKPSDCQLIFYPGALVDAKAYAPLMTAIAERGVNCCIVNMPFRLAFFGMDKADSVISSFPDIRHWYIGGHSLGGVMAAEYAAKRTDRLDGLVLLASYSSADLGDSALDVISVYGSKDNVLNIDTYRNFKDNLPQDFSEMVIDGGCHSYFGAYGMQDGDGEPEITREQQISAAADFIVQTIMSNRDNEIQIGNNGSLQKNQGSSD